MQESSKLRLRRIGVLVLCSGIFVWMLSVTLDPYTASGHAAGTLFMVLVFGILMVMLTKAIVMKKFFGIILGILLVVLLSCVAISNPWSLLRPTPAPTTNEDQALEVMDAMRLRAIACMESGEGLQGRRKSHRFSFSDAIGRMTPSFETSMCPGQLWLTLPDGWAYETIADGETDNGDFEIGAKSRDGKVITCSVARCSISNP